MGDKIVGRSLGWHVTQTQRPFVTPWMAIRRDEGRLPSGESFTYTYVEAAPAVFIVPVTPEGTVVLIRQYRYTVDAWCLEVPAGGTRDRRDQDLEKVARDELQEEVGGTCAELRHAGCFYPWHSRSDQVAHVFLATDVRLDRQPLLERTEQIELAPMSIARALDMARRGKVRDGQSALALMLCEPLIKEMGLDVGTASNGD